MSQLVIKYPPGATPLDPNERAGLIPTYITTNGELNQLERENIIEATKWALGSTNHDYLNVSFCLDLHKRMFNKVWRWAGTIRISEKNIGRIPNEQVLPKLKLLFEDVQYWMENQTYEPDEIAARFHHRLVFIHVFPNGNGRHARLLTEVLQTVNGEKPFTWGNSDLYGSESEARSNYIAALKLADAGDYSALIKFVRS